MCIRDRVSLTNSGTLNFAAAATAVGGEDVDAEAYVAQAVWQGAFAPNGTANVSFDNSGPLTVSAYATALGGGEGTAIAHAGGIEQLIAAGAGASASVYNTNTI